MNRDPNKLPFGRKYCKSAKCGQVITGLRTQVCPYCGFDQMADNKVKAKPSMKSAKIATAEATKRGPGRPPKEIRIAQLVAEAANIKEPNEMVNPTIPDPFTFTIPVNSLMVFGKPVAATPDNKYASEVVRHTTMYNGVSGLVAKPDVVIGKATRFANGIELTDLYGLEVNDRNDPDEVSNVIGTYTHTRSFDVCDLD